MWAYTVWEGTTQRPEYHETTLDVGSHSCLPSSCLLQSNQAQKYPSSRSAVAVEELSLPPKANPFPGPWTQSPLLSKDHCNYQSSMQWNCITNQPLPWPSSSFSPTPRTPIPCKAEASSSLRYFSIALPEPPWQGQWHSDPFLSFTLQTPLQGFIPVTSKYHIPHRGARAPWI